MDKDHLNMIVVLYWKGADGIGVNVELPGMLALFRLHVYVSTREYLVAAPV